MKYKDKVFREWLKQIGRERTLEILDEIDREESSGDRYVLRLCNGEKLKDIVATETIGIDAIRHRIWHSLYNMFEDTEHKYTYSKDIPKFCRDHKDVIRKKLLDS